MYLADPEKEFRLTTRHNYGNEFLKTYVAKRQNIQRCIPSPSPQNAYTLNTNIHHKKKKLYGYLYKV
jgi:hypothetical protein